LLLWVLGGLSAARPDPLALGVVAAVAVTATAREIGLVRFALPQNRRQVPQSVFYKGRQVAALQFGFEMGTGVMTYTTAAAPYVAAAMLLMANGSWQLPIATGVGFGLGRAVMPLSRYLSGTDDAWDDRLRRRTTMIAAACTAACAAGAILVTAAAA
jgi:hypothetical protein